MTDRLRELVRAALKTGEFTLASGKQSAFYFNGKEVTLHPEGALLVAERLCDLLAEDRPEALGGPALGACPMVSAAGVVARQRGLALRLFYVRAQAKDHGLASRIEGPPLPAGTRTALVEDVVTSGGSMLSAAEAARAAGLACDLAYCLVDREEGGAEALRAAGIRLRPLYRRTELLGV